MTGLMFPKQAFTKKRKRHSPSILQGDRKGTCYLCGRYGYTEEHHIFFGNSQRIHSEQYGLKVHLCPACHRTGREAAHMSKETTDCLHRLGQQTFEQRCGSRNDFTKIFGRNYL